MVDYKEVEILNNAYIDIIKYTGEEGVNSKLTVSELLPRIAAPYTQLLSRHTDTSSMRLIAEELVSFLCQTGMSFDKMEYEEILSVLSSEWIPTLSLEKAQELATNLSLIEAIDDEGFVVFKESIWKFYEKKSHEQYREVEYHSANDVLLSDKHYDFSSEKNVYTINGKRVRVWTLNTEGRNRNRMMEQDAVIVFNEYNATRDIHDFKSFESYRKAYFENKNDDKQYENWDHYITNDLRCFAYWRFCKIVKKGDIIYLGNGSQVYGYCEVIGEKVETSKEYNVHGWECKWTKYKYPIFVENLRATPFFMYVDQAKMNRIKAACGSVEQTKE